MVFGGDFGWLGVVAPVRTVVVADMVMARSFFLKKKLSEEVLSHNNQSIHMKEDKSV